MLHIYSGGHFFSAAPVATLLLSLLLDMLVHPFLLLSNVFNKLLFRHSLTELQISRVPKKLNSYEVNTHYST